MQSAGRASENNPFYSGRGEHPGFNGSCNGWIWNGRGGFMKEYNAKEWWNAYLAEAYKVHDSTAEWGGSYYGS